LKKTICIISSFLFPHPGGVERYAYNLAKGLAARGYCVILVGLNTEKLDNIQCDEEFIIIRLPSISLLKSRYPIPKINKELVELIKMLKVYKIDYIIINVRFYLLSVLSAVYAQLNNIPAIVIEHGTGHFDLGNGLINILSASYEHVITYIIKHSMVKFYGVSKACSEWLFHFGITADGVIYNGVDTKYQSTGLINYRTDNGITNEEIIITFVGRLIREKGINELVDAFKILSNDINNLKLIIAGDGILLNQLKQISNNRNDIIILGRINNDQVMELLKETDIFVLPTRFPEGLPTVLLEAGSQDCAIIATAKGGTIEIIPDERYGVILPDSSIESIIAAVIPLIKISTIRIAMARNLKMRISEIFDWNIIIDNFVKKVLINENYS
jgi:glycosyltransferase involved in cell wall biosynthesis